MPVVARQLGQPRGLFGRLIGRGLARSNANLNRWAVHEIGKHYHEKAGRIVEFGPGPGIGLEETLRVFPTAAVWGVDLSPEMLSQSRKRNRAAVDSGRLTLLQGDVASAAKLGLVDIILGVHVIYFWREPLVELTRLRQLLRPGGLLALGYQLRQNMPRVAQRDFPKEGYVLYESDADLTALLTQSGFRTVEVLVLGSADAPEGRLALATA
jgi:SAM-dependent methyltransferase